MWNTSVSAPAQSTVCEQALTGPEQPYEGDFPPAISREPAELDRTTVLSALQDEADRNVEMLGALGDSQWTMAALVMEMRWTLRFALPHIGHELLHHCDDIASGLADPD